jgi:hypothetical protein
MQHSNEKCGAQVRPLDEHRLAAALGRLGDQLSDPAQRQARSVRKSSSSIGLDGSNFAERLPGLIDGHLLDPGASA